MPVTAWLAGVEPDQLFVSVLSLGEIRRGIELIRKRDPASARALDKWLAGLKAHYADRILPISSAVADRWGRLSPDQPLRSRMGCWLRLASNTNLRSSRATSLIFSARVWLH